MIRWLQKLFNLNNPVTIRCLASSFADLADLRAFKKCKATGKTDKQCFAVGDNGIGCWGDLTAQDHTPMCALPPETMTELWGSKAKAKHRRVVVIYGNESVECVVADVMPSRWHIKNGCGIDLNPAAAVALGIKPPFKIQVTFSAI